MGRRVERFPSLYGQAANGKVKVWSIRAEEDKDGSATIITEYGYEDGEFQRASVAVKEGKNLGRANETTPFGQACSEAKSKWEKKLDKKYFPSKKDLAKSHKPLPMLAHDFKKRGKDIEWPALIQPKLNGIRCLATKVSSKTIEYSSRGGKEFTTLEHLTPSLLKVMHLGEIFDGELFTKGLTFQQITSAVKRAQDLTEEIEYWVYDVVQHRPFTERYDRLRTAELDCPLVLVPTYVAKDEKRMLLLHRQLVGEGYEGTIIRNGQGTYRENHRSTNLQKYKDFVDEEFLIVGGKEGVGKDEGAVTFVCKTEEGRIFECRPRGSYEQRREWWENLRDLIGKQLTVRYQTRSDDNVPIFPVGIAIRDYE